MARAAERLSAWVLAGHDPYELTCSQVVSESDLVASTTRAALALVAGGQVCVKPS
jgi:hypothetical protein